jgi:hypothetical protein
MLREAQTTGCGGLIVVLCFRWDAKFDTMPKEVNFVLIECYSPGLQASHSNGRELKHR